MKSPLRKTPAQGKERCFVVADDRQIQEKALTSTGAFFVDDLNLFAYNNDAGSMGLYTEQRKVKGKWTDVTVGQCALLFEQSSHPFIFSKLAWSTSSPQEQNILADARMEGIGGMIRDQGEDEKWMRFMPVLYGLVVILGLIVVIIALTVVF